MKPLEPEATFLSRWTSRLALFSLLLAVSTFFLHRLFGMPTFVAANILTAALLGALLVLLLAFAATINIWQTGGEGTARIVTGVSIALLLLAVPVAAAVMAQRYPEINDVTTDPRSPPAFQTLAKQRTPADNPARYPGKPFASKQARAYPDIKPLLIERTQSEVFDLVVEALKRLNLTIVREQDPNDETGAPGYIEAVDRSLILGLYGDVAIRVTGGEDATRVDLRSASRYGQHDLGENATRLRTIMREIVARLEETVPTADTSAKKRN